MRGIRRQRLNLRDFGKLRVREIRKGSVMLMVTGWLRGSEI